ncbi:hypothetical protein O181_009074 [Austropuccinia psidii MF-1]|uniref:Uncharacterized protein n=1 Tax=Austropuccinia psidii MF-1 TaxID=1389203 RepID=A0A9Q3GJH3_9BASI|nr:hypothetical protein [Austropuccinia psidii MF-1]
MQVLITLNPDHKGYHDPSNSSTNDSCSSNTGAALLSLLSSRDLVFKEIKDVGEDNSKYSLHLFDVNVDLPPSSYHDSLKALWDEEEEPEEIETMMKAVPSAYHHYLNVFSKVNSENHPPHCSCDHHIKIGQSLLPVWIIYSLSNQESETLRS